MLGSTATYPKKREKKCRCLKRHAYACDTLFLQESHGRIEDLLHLDVVLMDLSFFWLMNTRAQTFSDGDTSRDTALHAAFPHSAEHAEPHFTRKDDARDGTALTASLSTSRWRS